MSPPHSPLLPSSHPDDAGVPLIAHETTPQDADDDPARSVHLHLQSRAEDALSTPALFTWLLAAGAGVSGLLFGYDTGVISSTLVGIGTDLTGSPLTTLEKSLITSCTSLAAFLINPFAGVLCDRLGRRPVLVLADVLFIFGALWQSLSPGVWHMIGGRCVIGFAIGAASFVVPMYISELAPSHYRGRLVMISTLFITAGQVIAYLAGWLLSTTHSGWRILVALGALPAVIQLVLMTWMPETPRWLVTARKKDVARDVLSKIYDAPRSSRVVEGVLSGIIADLSKEGHEVHPLGTGLSGLHHSEHSTWLRFKTKFAELTGPGSSRRALVIACVLQGLQQLCGFNSLMYFSATIFDLIGFHNPTLDSLAIAITNFVFTVVAFYAIDNVGRRRILLYSLPVMVVSLLMSSFAFNYIDLSPSGSPTGDSAPRPATAWPVVVLMSLVLYVAGYAIGIGNVPWQQSELFPLSVRSLGSSFATSVNWFANFIVGMTFLPMLQLLSGPVTFGFYALVCVGGWFVLWSIYPETAGLSLEDVNALLQHSWGVRDSVIKFRARGAIRGEGSDPLLR